MFRGLMRGMSVVRSSFVAVWIVLLTGMAWGDVSPDVLYYQFNEGSGTTTANLADPGQGTAMPEFTDASGNPLAPEWLPDAPLGDFAAGVANFPTRLPTGYDPANLNNSDWTFEFWVRVSPTIDRRNAVFTDGSDFGIYVHPNGHAVIFDNTTNSFVTTVQSVATGDWVHVAFAYDSSSDVVATFVNGVITNAGVFNYNIAAGELFVMRGGFVINLTGTPREIWSFNHDLDEFRLWSYRRTNAEILLFHQQEAPFEEGLHAWRLGVAVGLPVAAGESVVAGRMVGYAIEEQEISEIHFEQAGNAEGLRVHVWVDDQAAFDPTSADFLGQQGFTNGEATVEFDPPLVIEDEDWLAFFFLIEVGSQAEAGSTFAPRLVSGASFEVADGPVHELNFEFPTEWVQRIVFGPHRGLPFGTSFEEMPFNLRFVSGAGDYPVAPAAGASVDSRNVSDTARARLTLGDPSGESPASGTAMAGIDFPNGEAIGALDLHFDLGGLDFMLVPLELSFRWNNTDLAPDDANNVFVSVDGGDSWIASVYHFPAPQASGWNMVTLDLSNALMQGGATPAELTDLVVRFQAHGEDPFDDAGLLIDDVALSIGSALQVQRVGTGQVLEHDGSDDWGMIAGPGMTTVLYALENVGHGFLAINDASAANFNGTTGTDTVMVDFPQPVTLSPGEITTVAVTTTLDGTGAIDFDLEIASNDPTLNGGIFRVAVNATADDLAPTIVAAPSATGVSGNQADGFAYDAVIDVALSNLVLLAEDPNGAPIEIVAVEGSVVGVDAPQPSAPQAGPVQLAWTGTPEQSGRFTYTIEVSDGTQTSTTTLTLLVKSDVPDVLASISCGANPSSNNATAVTLLLLLATLLLALGAARRHTATR